MRYTFELLLIPRLHAPYKINFDGALFKDIFVAGLGVVIYNSRGEIVGAMSEKIPIPFTAEEVGG